MMALPPDKALAARVIDVLQALSPRNLADLRAGHDPTYTSQVPRRTLRALAEALEAAWPGVLDEAIRIEARDREETDQ